MDITVRTPAGANRRLAIEPDDTADQLVGRAVHHFVAHAQLELGSFRLGLLRGRRIVDLAGEVRLVDAGVAEGDVLHLLTSERQVDG